ncbi:LysE family translocator [Marinobacter lutaoensis]|uniref:LysE family translocator n=1 Tax=Marinobacter lutaoensis TaxID=135739 RepID=UPI0015947497|nr:LysE family translocator [Marinobacter lutaoensis]NVD37032.1 LysE family translocator [Marinobacter lutaoensis]
MPDLIWAYLVAITLLTVSPGADTLLVVRNTGRGGVVDGCVTSLGICLGLFVHATLSALGISVLLVETAWAFTLLKWAGALYLIWLGLGSLRRAVARVGPAAEAVASPPGRRPLGIGQALREGLLSNLLNPKTALFYMALLPQFIDPAGSAFQQSLWLAAVHFGVAMIWQCGLAWAVGRFRGLGSSERLRRMLGTLTGGFFVALGAKLALS